MENIDLPVNYHFGVSAATGGLAGTTVTMFPLKIVVLSLVYNFSDMNRIFFFSR